MLNYIILYTDRKFCCQSTSLFTTTAHAHIKFAYISEIANYFGLQYWLKILLKQHIHAHVTQQLTLHINIDGIPLFKSSKISLWPILGYISEFKSEPFPIVVYCSDKKPDPIKNYVKDFIEEQLVLQQAGFLYEGVLYKIKLDAVICDAPAGALVKCITTHNGYRCCERCVQRGEWCQKVILPTLDAPLRTDINFYEQKDKKHHCKDISPFVELGFGMVTCFPLDYMHLICLGVMRRLLHCWLNGPRGHHAKLPHNIIGAVSDLLVNLRPHIPREFARKPRSLAEYKLWKAAELRLFLLYTGPVVLKGFLSPAAYANFLDLSIAIRILLSPSLCQYYVDFAESLLKYFVFSLSTIYGREHLVYNIHSLAHIADDARKYGVLDNVASFKFENYLGKLKKLIRQPLSPCGQIVRRLLENNRCLQSVNKDDSFETFKKPCYPGSVPLSYRGYEQFEQYHGNKFFIAITDGDNCCEIKGKFGLVRCIMRPKVTDLVSGYVVFEEFENLSPFFMEPLKSTDIYIFFVQNCSGRREVCALEDISTKCILLPYKSGHVLLPQLHY